MSFRKQVPYKMNSPYFITGLENKLCSNCGALKTSMRLLQKQILATPATDHLISQIAEHIKFALIHPINESTKIADVIPVLTIDKIAQYVASKSGHRQRLIKTVVNNPAFFSHDYPADSALNSRLLNNSVMTKRVPGVSSFMKMGKSVLETVTDSNLNDTIGHCLQKNILKLSQ